MIENPKKKDALLSAEEQLQVLMNLLADPEDTVSRRIIALSDEYEEASKRRNIERDGSNPNGTRE